MLYLKCVPWLQGLEVLEVPAAAQVRVFLSASARRLALAHLPACPCPHLPPPPPHLHPALDLAPLLVQFCLFSLHPGDQPSAQYSTSEAELVHCNKSSHVAPMGMNRLRCVECQSRSLSDSGGKDLIGRTFSPCIGLLQLPAQQHPVLQL